MSAEREIAGFVLPFTVGVISSAYLFQHIYTVSAASEPLFFLISSLCLVIIPGSSYKSINPKALYTALAVSVFCAGCFCHSVALHSQPLGAGISSTYRELAAGFGASMREAILRIPFADTNSNHLINALVTGERGEISKEILEAFRMSGASHILALSGFHLGIIYGILRLISAGAGNSRPSKIIRSIIVILICGFYTSATGSGSSITRAFLFILLGETAALTGRQRNTRTILWSALIIQLTLSPSEITDIGFQLSYAAMAGIAYIYPRIKDFWSERDNKSLMDKALHWIWNTAAMSIACQVTTGPLVWIYFGTFPQYFLLTNMIALPLTSLIIPLSLTCLLLNSIGLCPEILLKLTEGTINILVESLKTISTL